MRGDFGTSRVITHQPIGGTMRFSPATLAIAAFLIFMMPGCATIVGGGSSQPVTFQSTPASATFTVQASSGLQMGQGTTPSTLRLPRKNEYQVQIALEGYQTQTAVLTKGINGWIWGNLFVGWIVGFAIDFISGSAYKLEPSLVQVVLQQSGEDTYAVIRLLDDRNRVVDERRVLMIPEATSRR